MRLVLSALCVAGVFAGGGRADEKKDLPKVAAKGSLTLGDTTYKLASVLAYETTIGKHKRTVVFLTEKSLNTDKLKASFAKHGNDEDFYPFDIHVKLLLNDKGELEQVAVQGDGGSTNRIGDKNITATVTIKDDSAKGKAGTVKIDKAFGKAFKFEVEFEVKLMKP